MGLPQQFREHFGHRDHLYGELLARLADDLEDGGPTAEICEGHLDAPRADAVALRLLAGIFRIVLRGDAPALERFYPALGGTAPADQVWPVLAPLLVTHVEELRRSLDVAPQTNEVGRSACLVIALFEAVRRHGVHRIRLLELGSSAGLNLLVDRYRFTGKDRWASGPPDSPLVLETGAETAEPEDFELVERRGCDLFPVDASTTEGRRHLTSFVWPFDLVRHERLAAALEIARRHPVTVERGSAEEWLEGQLRAPSGEEVLTVVWQSITEQYWPPVVSAAVAEQIEQGRQRMPLAHITLEGVPSTTVDPKTEHGPELRLDGVLLARAHYHGPPVDLCRAPAD